MERISTVKVLAIGLVALCGMSPRARAATIAFTDKAAFLAQLESYKTIDFNSFPSMSFSDAAGLTVDGVNFVGTAAGEYWLFLNAHHYAINGSTVMLGAYGGYDAQTPIPGITTVTPVGMNQAKIKSDSWASSPTSR